MVIFIRGKPGEVMLNNEFIDERPAVPGNHRAIPNAGDQTRQRNAPNQAHQKSLARPFTSQEKIETDDTEDQDKPNQSFRQQREAGEEIEAEEQPFAG